MSEVSMTDNNTVDERPVVLKVDHVAKSFRLPTEQATGLKMAFLNWTKGIKGYTEQHVLRDINFEVHQGDFFGIVGRNGSGKSTLLKISKYNGTFRMRKIHPAENHLPNLCAGTGRGGCPRQAGAVHRIGRRIQPGVDRT